MTAWVELFRDNPGACLCLTVVTLGGVAAVIAAIRRAGGM